MAKGSSTPETTLSQAGMPPNYMTNLSQVSPMGYGAVGGSMSPFMMRSMMPQGSSLFGMAGNRMAMGQNPSMQYQNPGFMRAMMMRSMGMGNGYGAPQFNFGTPISSGINFNPMIQGASRRPAGQ